MYRVALINLCGLLPDLPHKQWLQTLPTSAGQSAKKSVGNIDNLYQSNKLLITKKHHILWQKATK